MKACFDANVVIDILCRTASYPESLVAYDVANLCRFDVVITAATTPTIDYILGKYHFEDGEGRSNVSVLRTLFDIIDVTSDDCRRADHNDMADYEDALVAESALRNGADVIVTRNKRDFAHSPVKAFTPQEFVAAFKPDGYEFDMVDW